MGVRPYRLKDIRAWGDYALFTLEGEVAPSHPGQFYMIRGDWNDDPLLARPISILEDDPACGTVRFLIKVVGKGTRLLASSTAGDRLFALGPLGGAFPDEDLPEPVVLVGGGVGVPPVYYLAKRLRERGVAVRFFQGARTSDDLLMVSELGGLGVDVVLSTEDGSRGVRGMVTEPLGEALGEGAGMVCACGPEGMLRAVTGLCGGDIPCKVSLEARMGCGYGVCLGCVVPIREGKGRVYRRVCMEGPVFDGEEVLWE